MGMEGKYYRPERYQIWDPVEQRMFQVARLSLDRDEADIGWDTPGIYYSYPMKGAKLRKWTYLTDKNGKDLYTGDVCRLFDWPEDQYRVQVMWCNNGFYIVSCAVEAEDLSPQLIPHDLNGKCDSLEIIGDVYRNPELSAVYDANGAGGYI